MSPSDFCHWRSSTRLICQFNSCTWLRAKRNETFTRSKSHSVSFKVSLHSILSRVRRRSNVIKMHLLEIYTWYVALACCLTREKKTTKGLLADRHIRAWRKVTRKWSGLLTFFCVYFTLFFFCCGSLNFMIPKNGCQ